MTTPIPKETIQALISQHSVKKLRMEVVINELLRQEIIKRADVVVTPEPTTIYNFEADVSINNSPAKYWEISTPQVSFYDRLPEQLFHKPVRPTISDNKFQLIRQEEEKQEHEGRKFFLPFDNRLYQYRIAIEKLEEEGLSGDNGPLLQRLVALLWTSEFPAGLLTPLQLVKLIQYLPTVHNVVGNLTLSAKYLYDITGIPIQLSKTMLSIGSVQTAKDFKGVGESIVGIDSALVGHAIDTTYPLITIQVGPIIEEQVPAFVPGGEWRRLLDLLFDLLLPIEVDYSVELVTNSTDTNWLVSKQTAAGLLGYTTYL